MKVNVTEIFIISNLKSDEIILDISRNVNNNKMDIEDCFSFLKINPILSSIDSSLSRDMSFRILYHLKILNLEV